MTRGRYHLDVRVYRDSILVSPSFSGSQAPAWEPVSPKLRFAGQEAELPKRAFPSRSLGTSANIIALKTYILIGNPAQLPGSVLGVFCRLWKE